MDEEVKVEEEIVETPVEVAEEEVPAEEEVA
jgi:hypothetical protein